MSVRRAWIQWVPWISLSVFLVVGCGDRALETSSRPIEPSEPIELPAPAGLDGLDRTVLALYERLADRAREREGVPVGERAEALGELGRWALVYRESALAEAAFTEAARIAPEDPLWLFYLGFTGHRFDDLALARRGFEAVLERDPGDRTARIFLAESELEAGELERAEALFRSALPDEDERGSGAARILAGRAEIALARRQWREAAELYEEALEMQPKADAMLQGLAAAYRGLGRGDEANRLLEGLDSEDLQRVQSNDRRLASLDRLQVSSRHHARRGREALSAGRPVEAIEHYRRAIDAGPDRLGPRLSLGHAQLDAGRPTEALAIAASAVDRWPENADAHFLLATALRRVGRREAALERVRRVLEIDPDLGAAYRFEGELLLESGQAEEAARAFARALEWIPEGTTTRRLHVEALHRAGRFDEARAALAEHRRAAPEARSLALLEVRLLAASPEAAVRDGDHALILAEELFAARPDLAAAEAVALAFAERGEFEQAVAWQEAAEETVRDAGRLDLAAPVRTRLASYRAGEPWRQPLASFPDLPESRARRPDPRPGTR